MKLIPSTLAIAAAVLAAACNPYSPDLGDRPFRCGTTEPRCPEGYTCVVRADDQQFCELSSGVEFPDARPTPPDAGLFTCNDDNELEPNDAVATATVTPIPELADEYSLVGLAICPDIDKDLFRFVIDETGKNATVTIDYESGRGTLLLDILAANGASIREGEAVGGDPNMVAATVPNLPDGTYFAQVRAAGAGIRNNYQIAIVTTGP